MRNMSFALTTDQVLAQTKDVTRRMGWLFLKPGDLIQPVKKAMGLRKGEQIEKIGGPVRVVSVTRERLDRMVTEQEYGFDEVRREGFDGHPVKGWPSQFVEFFAAVNKCTPETVITRIEFAYTEPAP